LRSQRSTAHQLAAHALDPASRASARVVADLGHRAEVRTVRRTGR
jgi:hypothetical protein